MRNVGIVYGNSVRLNTPAYNIYLQSPKITMAPIHGPQRKHTKEIGMQQAVLE